MIYLIMILLVSGSSAATTALNTVRDTFFEAEGSKLKTSTLLKLTEDSTLDKEPIKYAYNGVARAMWAEYEYNPLTKLSSFNKGKDKLEKTIKANPDMLELRFLRFTIQAKAPSMLGYRSNIEEDKKFIVTNLSKVKNKELSNNYCIKVVDFLLNSDLCTEEEKKKLKSN